MSIARQAVQRTVACSRHRYKARFFIRMICDFVGKKREGGGGLTQVLFVQCDRITQTHSVDYKEICRRVASASGEFARANSTKNANIEIRLFVELL